MFGESGSVNSDESANNRQKRLEKFGNLPTNDAVKNIEKKPTNQLS